MGIPVIQITSDMGTPDGNTQNNGCRQIHQTGARVMVTKKSLFEKIHSNRERDGK